MLIYWHRNTAHKYMNNYKTQVISAHLSTQILRGTIQVQFRGTNFSRFLLALTEEGLKMNTMIQKMVQKCSVLNIICIWSLQITIIDQLWQNGMSLTNTINPKSTWFFVHFLLYYICKISPCKTHHHSEVRLPINLLRIQFFKGIWLWGIHPYFTTPALGCKPYGIYYTYTNYLSITSEGNSKFLMQPVMHMFWNKSSYVILAHSLIQGN